MRVVILSDRVPPERVGGAESVAWSLARGLRDAGHDVRVVAATPGAPFSEERGGILTHHLHSQYRERLGSFLTLYNPQTVGPMRALLRQVRPDVLNAHNIHNDLSYWCLRVADTQGIPVVFSSHDVMPVAYEKIRHFVGYGRLPTGPDYRLPRFANLRTARLRYNPWRNVTIRKILRDHAQVRTCVSDSLRQALEVNGLPPFKVVYNGVEVPSDPSLRVAATTTRERLGLAGRRVVAFAGRVNESKGSRQLFRALSCVVERVPSLSLMVLGNTRLGDLDQQGLNEPGCQVLRDRLCLAGRLTGRELAAAYRSADVLTVPSICLDSAPLVSLEAMAQGTPVVGTCYGGLPELVTEGVTGFIVNPFDTVAFANRIEQLLTDEEMRLRMGDAGIRRVRSTFSLARQVRDMEAAYREATEAGSRRLS